MRLPGILEPYPIDIVGLNCATGPDKMKEHIRYWAENFPFVVSCIPNAGLPENMGGQAHYRLTPMELSMALMHFVEDLGVQRIGGCCGPQAPHIAQLAERSKNLNAEDWDGLVPLGREQVREGAHILDVNVDDLGRDGVRDMHELVSQLVTNVTLPLLLDSTE